MKYDAVIFDLDGTILDTLDDLADSTNFALTKNRLPARTRDEIRQFVGNGIRKLMERACPSGTGTMVINKVHADFSIHYKEHCADKTAPYSNIPEVIGSLREMGIKTAVISNKADYAVKDLCSKYFPESFDCCLGEREGVARKPSPDSLNETLRLLGVSKERTLYVGDSDVDIKTAKNAGCDCLCVLWGFRDREFLARNSAENFAETAEDILSYIK